MRRNILKQNISRLTVLLLAVTLVFACVPTASAAESGSCGANLSWSFADGILTISGSGAMTNYGETSLPPWYSFRDRITAVSLPEGLTSVGSMAFYDCVNLLSVSLPSTVTAVGDMAFCQNRAMTMLTLNNGLKTIGRFAFEQCESLQDVRIPNTVTVLGDRAFYLCKSLTYVTVPSSVTSMGLCVFAYCDRLAGADVNANVSSLPSWTFLGCSGLNSVSFGGTPVSAAEAKSPEGQTPSAIPTAPIAPSPETDSAPGGAVGNTASSGTIWENPSGETGATTTTTTQTGNSTVNVNTDYTVEGDTVKAEQNITATVVTPEGWNEIVDQIVNAQSAQEGNNSESLDVTVYLPNNDVIPEDVLSDLAGENVVLDVQTQSGAKYTIDFSDISEKDIKGDFSLKYVISTADTLPEELAGLQVYCLKFQNSIAINAEVVIRIPGSNARRSASLYQFASDGMLMHLQSVVVDDENFAHYYLSAVDEKTEYLIAMDVPTKEATQAIIPQNLYDESTLIDQATGKAYVVTGRTSSWGMGLGKVMTILAVVMVSMIVIVGFVMYAWNKRRLKMGYVPDLDEEDYM